MSRRKVFKMYFFKKDISWPKLIAAIQGNCSRCAVMRFTRIPEAPLPAGLKGPRRTEEPQPVFRWHGVELHTVFRAWQRKSGLVVTKAK